MGDIIFCNYAHHNCYQLQFCICGRETHASFVLIVILFNQKLFIIDLQLLNGESQNEPVVVKGP